MGDGMGVRGVGCAALDLPLTPPTTAVDRAQGCRPRDWVAMLSFR
jgi:hypothetical protein